MNSKLGRILTAAVCTLCLLLLCAAPSALAAEPEIPVEGGVDVEMADATGEAMSGEAVLGGRRFGIATLCVFSGADGRILISTEGKRGYYWCYSKDGALVTPWKITSSTGSLQAYVRIKYKHAALVRVMARKSDWDAARPDEEQLLWIEAYGQTQPNIVPANVQRREMGHSEQSIAFETGIPGATVELWDGDGAPVTTAVADENGYVIFDSLHAADGQDHYAATLYTFGNYDVHAATAYASDLANLLPAVGGTGVEWATSNGCATYVSRILAAGGFPIYAPYASSAANPGGSVRHVLESLIGSDALKTEFTIDDFHEGDLVWGHNMGHVMYCAAVNREENTIHVYGHSASASGDLSDDGWVDIGVLNALMQMVQEEPVDWTYRIDGVADPRLIVLEAGEDGAQTSDIAREGSTYQLPENPFEPPEHSFFAGWLVDGTCLQPGEEITVAGHMHITAQWRDSILRGEADLVLPGSIRRIEANAFEQIAARSVYIPDGCTGIGPEAFRDCPNLRRIRIPADCAIDETAFSGCGEITVFSAPDSPADLFCQGREGFLFQPEELPAGD